MENTIKRLKLFTIINSVVSVALAVTTIFTAIKVVEVENYLDKVSGLEGINDAVFLDGELPGTEITGAERDELVTKILNDVTALKSKNLYLSASRGGEVNSVLVTNQYGESVYQMEDGNMTVYLNDGNTVYYSDKIYYGSDVDFITLSKAVADIAVKGNGTVIKIADTNETGVIPNSGIDYEVVEYAIDIKGWDNIKQIYTSMNPSHADEFIENLKNVIKSSQPNVDVEHTNMRLTYGYHADEIQALGMYYYFGEDSKGSWNNCYQDWFIEGIVEVYEWSLGDDWYNYDFTKMAESDGTELSNMMQTVYDNISEMLKKFEEDNGLASDENTSESDTETEYESSGGNVVTIPIS